MTKMTKMTNTPAEIECGSISLALRKRLANRRVTQPDPVFEGTLLLQGISSRAQENPTENLKCRSGFPL